MGVDGARAWLEVPFPPLPAIVSGTDPREVLVAHAARLRTVGVILVRRRGHAIGVFSWQRPRCVQGRLRVRAGDHPGRRLVTAALRPSPGQPNHGGVRRRGGHRRAYLAAPCRAARRGHLRRRPHRSRSRPGRRPATPARRLARRSVPVRARPAVADPAGHTRTVSCRSRQPSALTTHDHLALLRHAHKRPAMPSADTAGMSAAALLTAASVLIAPPRTERRCPGCSSRRAAQSWRRRSTPCGAVAASRAFRKQPHLEVVEHRADTADFYQRRGGHLVDRRPAS